jgi:SAM-dependent methyltransferase
VSSEQPGRAVGVPGGDRWSSGDAYEAYVGRWSRQVAVEFIDWLDVASGQRWLDVGSGTGALTQTVLARRDPRSVVGVDPSETFVAHARASVLDPRVSFTIGSAAATGMPDESVDVVVSGLVFNFVPDLAAALEEGRRVVARGGLVAAYVWDYAEGMQFMRRFWDVAVALDTAAEPLDEGRRFLNTAPEPLAAAFGDAGLVDVDVRPIVVPTVFADFDDLWRPFLGGTGTAPAYLATLSEPAREALRDQLRASMTPEADGTIKLAARAWAARGRRPH